MERIIAQGGDYHRNRDFMIFSYLFYIAARQNGIIRAMSGMQAIIHKCEAPETGYWAEVPALPGCVTQGETLEEVRAMIQDAVSAWLSAAWDLAMKGRKPRLAKTDIMEPVFA